MTPVGPATEGGPALVRDRIAQLEETVASLAAELEEERATVRERSRESARLRDVVAMLAEQLAAEMRRGGGGA